MNKEDFAMPVCTIPKVEYARFKKGENRCGHYPLYTPDPFFVLLNPKNPEDKRLHATCWIGQLVIKDLMIHNKYVKMKPVFFIH